MIQELEEIHLFLKKSIEAEALGPGFFPAWPEGLHFGCFNKLVILESSEMRIEVELNQSLAAEFFKGISERSGL